MGEFMVGDIVKIVNNQGSYHQVGNVGEIIEICSNSPYPLYVKSNGLSGYYGPLNESQVTHDTDIKVGDRIRVTGSNIGDKWNGRIGIVKELGRNPAYPFFTDHIQDGYRNKDGLGIWCNGFKVSNDTPLTKDNMKGEGDKMDNEQVTRDGYVYTKLKSLSPESVLKGGPCREEFNNYTYQMDGFYDDVKLEVLMSVQEGYPEWLPWLISHGYIGKEEVKKVKVKKIATWECQRKEVSEDNMVYFSGRRGNGDYPSYHCLPKDAKYKVTIEWEE